MQTTDRARLFRSAGMAVAALLLVGGAVFGSQAVLSGGSDSLADDEQSQSFDASESPEASDEQGENEQIENAQDASESPEASDEQSEDAAEDAAEDANDADDDASESPDGSPEESDDADDDASESPEASESPDGDD